MHNGLYSVVGVYFIFLHSPRLGFITFWVFDGRQEEELKRVARLSLVASFIGTIVWIILLATGVIAISFLGIGLSILSWLLG